MVKRASLGRCLGATSSIMGTGEIWTPHRFGYSVEKRDGTWEVGIAAPGMGWGGGSSQLITPLVLPHLYPVAGCGKGWSVVPSPLPSYTACAVA